VDPYAEAMRGGRPGTRAASLAAPVRTLADGREAAEQPLHRVDLRQVGVNVVIAAFLAGGQLEASPRERVAPSGAAKVNDRGQVLLLLDRGGRGAVPRHRAGDAPVEQRRGHLDGVARDAPRGGAVVTTRAP